MYADLYIYIPIIQDKSALLKFIYAIVIYFLRFARNNKRHLIQSDLVYI